MRGHVRQRGKSWSYVVDVGVGANGKRRQEWKGGFKTKREADKALALVLRDLAAGTYVVRSRATLGEFLAEWHANLQLKPASVYAYGKTIRLHVSPLLGHVKLQQLDPPMVRQFYAQLMTAESPTGRALSGTSVQLVHQMLHRAMNDAMREGLVVRNVVSLVKPLRRTTAERSTWTAEELRCFLQRTQGEEDFALWLILATTGMRRGEVCGLQWRDFDAERETLTIQRTLSFVGGQMVLGTPKTTRGRRTVSLDPETCSQLRRVRTRYLEQQLATGASPASDDMIFTGRWGQPLQPCTIGQRFQKLRTEVGLPHIRLHDLRHTYATIALETGVHPKVVSERLGHASITITLDLYAHVLPSIERAAALRVSELFVPVAASGSRIAEP